MSAGESLFLKRVGKPGPLVAVELRPPRSGMDATRSMDVWIDMHHALRRLGRQGTFVLLTDDAVGDREEESLAHLAANLGAEAAPRPAGAGSRDFDHVLPFLTCKHPEAYCRLFARRAAELGVAGVTVVGGDRCGGLPRCVPHGRDLRRILRADLPDLALGGWANPHRDPVEQARFVAAEGFEADYVLTQVVSHHSMAQVERFQSELARRGVALPVVYGVFLYRSANPRTLKQLGRFFPVPAAALAREFNAGDDPFEICARTIRALRSAGADKVYVSNIAARDGPQTLARLA